MSRSEWCALIALTLFFPAELHADTGVPVMIAIPKGAFVFGTADPLTQPFMSEELPEINIDVDAFEISQTEITEQYWSACVNAGRCNALPSYVRKSSKHPARNMSWQDAQTYVAWLNDGQSEYAYSLPTERQWEYAAKAGLEQDYWRTWTATTKRENVRGDRVPGQVKTYFELLPVSVSQLNEFGVANMIGGVSEYTRECWNDTSRAREGDTENIVRSESPDCKYIVVRGGNFATTGNIARPTMRFLGNPSGSAKTIGFRVVRVPADYSPSR